MPQSSEGCLPDPLPSAKPNVEQLEKNKDKKKLEEIVGIFAGTVFVLAILAGVVLYYASLRHTSASALKTELDQLQAQESNAKILSTKDLLTAQYT